MGNNTRYTEETRKREAAEDARHRAEVVARQGMDLLTRALATGADQAHLVWRALRPDLVEHGLIARDVHIPPAGPVEAYSPPPAPEHPPRPRPPLGQELHDLEQALAMCEELDGPLNERQLETLADLTRRLQRLRTRLLVASSGGWTPE